MTARPRVRPRVLVAIGTRPEAIKLARVVHALRDADFCDVRVLSTGQHREILDPILRFFEITPDVMLDVMSPRQSLAELTSRLTIEVDRVLAAEDPDLVVVQGDTTTVFVTALCAFYRGIRVAHVEAGLRTHDVRRPFPEELNRQMVSRVASLHCAPTRRAADNLVAEGIDVHTIHVTGNPVVDSLLWTAGRVDPSAFAASPGRRRVLVTAHRRESHGEPLSRLFGALRTLADRDDVELLVPVHPHPAVRSAAERVLAGHPRIELREPLGYPEFVAAMQAAHFLITDSGGVQEEAPSLGKPVLVTRRESDRPEGIEAGTALLVGTEPERLLACADELLDDERAYAAMVDRRNPYGDGTAAAAIVERLRDALA